MRKAILLTSAVALVSLAGPALAQATGTVDIDGSVQDRCLFTSPSATISVGELSQSGTGANAGKLDPSKLDGQQRTLVGWCNGTAAKMSVEALPLLNGDFVGTAPSGFDTRINYSATASANGVEASDGSATAGAGSAVNVGLFAGDVVVALSNSNTPGGGLLVAGGYSGEVRVTLTPNASFN